MLILGVFLLALAAGVVSTAFWIREDELGRGYFQTNALIVLGLLALLAAMVATDSIDLWPGGGARILLASIISAAVAYGFLMRERWAIARWSSAACLAFLTLLLWRVEPTPRYPTSSPMLMDAALSLSALVLGWSLITMLLGHWYLVAPKLNFRHLKRFCWVLTGLLIVRAFASLAAMAVALRMAETSGWVALISPGGWGMFLWVRVLWGLVGALLLSAMALHCARHGSNQSATGILYVVVVSVWIGEATALFLLAMTGVPV